MLELLGALGKDVLVSALSPILREGSEKAQEWVRNYLKRDRNAAEDKEIPPEVEKEVGEAVQSYLESPNYSVYMDGVIFFFQETLDEDMKQELREIIGQLEWDSSECSEAECRAYQLIQQYMAGEREEETNDFGFEENFLYLNFHSTRSEAERIFNESGLRELADALNQLLPDENQIVSFRGF